MSRILLQQFVFIGGDYEAIEKHEDYYWINNIKDYESGTMYEGTSALCEVINLKRNNADDIIIALSKIQWRRHLKPELDRYLPTGSDASCKYQLCENAQAIREAVLNDCNFASEKKGEIFG